jgi:probable rRNA maturation factor
MKSKIVTSKITLFVEDTGRSQIFLRKRSLLQRLKQSVDVMASEFKKLPNIELSLVLCGEKKITSLNGQYRGKNKRTDVLSFPVFEDLRSELKKHNIQYLLNMGDIYICKDVAIIQARRFGISVEEELVHLFIHGFLHLLGYDHEKSKREEDIMFSLEDRLLSLIYT